MSIKKIVITMGLLTFATFAHAQNQENIIESSDISSLFLVSPSQFKFKNKAGLDLAHVRGDFGLEIKNIFDGDYDYKVNGARIQYFPGFALDKLYIGFNANNVRSDIDVTEKTLVGFNAGTVDRSLRTNSFSMGGNIIYDLGEISLGIRSEYIRDFTTIDNEFPIADETSRDSYSLTEISMQLEMIENTDFGITMALGKDDVNAGIGEPPYLQVHAIHSFSDQTDIGLVLKQVQSSSIEDAEDKNHWEALLLARQNLGAKTSVEGAFSYYPKYYEEDKDLTVENAESYTISARLFQNISESLWAGMILHYTRDSDTAGEYTIDSKDLQFLADLAYHW